MLRDQQLVDEVEILLPSGETARFRLHGQKFSYGTASCFVINNAGDDLDVINGAEIHAEVTLAEATGDDYVVIRGARGIGRATKPGLAVPPGEWAIDPVPRRMITESVTEVFPLHCPLLTTRHAPLVPHVTISIPNGEELAKKTLNERLGIIGGLSILGTTGIISPVSKKAWADTIDAAINVAVACGCTSLVLATDRTSEAAARRYFSTGLGSVRQPDRAEAARKGYRKLIKGIYDESFIMMGYHVGLALRSCQRKKIRYVVLAAQFTELLKIACGHEEPHVSSSEGDLDRLREWLCASRRTSRFAIHARRDTTARGFLEATGTAPQVISLVAARASLYAEQFVHGIRVKVLVAGYNEEVLYFR